MSLGQFTLLYLALHLGMPTGLASLLVQAQVIFTIGLSRVVLGERPDTAAADRRGPRPAGLAALVIGRGSHTPLGPLAITIGGLPRVGDRQRPVAPRADHERPRADDLVRRSSFRSRRSRSRS